MPLVNAGRAFLLDVRQLAVGSNLAIVSGHTPACERREAEKMNETHHVNVRSENQQILYRIERFCRPRALAAIASKIPAFLSCFVNRRSLAAIGCLVAT
jgi:hypothetical protein